MAAAKGYTITAISRSISSELIENPLNVTPVDADVLDTEALVSILAGHAAVISCLGPGSTGENSILYEGMASIVAASRIAGVPRIIGIGGAGLLDIPGNGMWCDSPGFPGFLRDISRAHRKALQVLQQSALEWTFVCPPMMQQDEATGEYRVQADQLLDAGLSIRFSDVADFIVREIAECNYIGRRVAIAY
jgi:putative NADH-flavin reductase